jgi:hypothetical protein
VRSGLVDEIEARVATREDELLRQMSDVFKELARLSVDLGAISRAVEGVQEKLDAQAVLMVELTETTRIRLDATYESIELLGRLLESARSRLDVLEEVAREPA